MSYDVEIGDEWLNYTSNMASLFYDHIPAVLSRGGIHELHGLTGKQAIPILTDAFARISKTYIKMDGAAHFRAKYDAHNGWGSTDGAILFLTRILAACLAYQRKKIEVSA